MADRYANESEAARERQSYVRHELRSPLAVMLPALSLLLEGGAGDLGPKQRQYVETLARSADRLEAMIASFADSGWFDCAAAPANPADVPLGAVVEEVLAMRHFARLGGPPVETRISRADETTVRADREHVRRILGNLLDNAARFTPATGSVVVAVRAGSPGSVDLEVRDDGCGIPAEEVPAVLGFGFRGAAGLEAGPPGLGIGLWVTRRLAELNGGSVSIVSAESEGTTVRVTLPAAPLA